MKCCTEIAPDGSFHTQKVYIIFRVFEIDKGSLDMKVYVDPWKLKEDAKLRFSMDKWTVVPGRG